MSDFDLARLDDLLIPFIPLGRSGLLPALHAAQREYGWLSEPVAEKVAHTLSIPLADVHGVIQFYTMFYNQPVGSTIVRICTDPACSLRGSDTLLSAAQREIADASVTIEHVPCLGLCDHAPAALVNDSSVTSAAGVMDLRDTASRPQSMITGSLRMLTANCGNGTTSLQAYEASGGYTAIRKALKMGPDDLVREVNTSGLFGRGGAAFPTGIKQEGAYSAPGEVKYVICNADESEPGTFKDRVLLLDDPHLMLEGMLITSYAIRSNKGYIYLRGEYPYVQPVLETALDEARRAGYLGKNILGSGHDFEIELRMGAGAYICGEETALFESIEGKRGFPRVKPPFPTTHGLFGKPTVINNVETFCNLPIIVNLGTTEYRKIGTAKSPGPKLFCVSGDVQSPGVVEVAFGATMREVIKLAGGLRNGNKLQAVLVGGAAGSFARPDQIDVMLTIEDLRAQGLPLGSGVLMVFDETRDLRDVLSRLGRFFAHESCGKCYPCQLGTQRQAEILDRLVDRQLLSGDLERLNDVGWTMTESSLCGLGQTAAMAVLSAMKNWPELFENGSEIHG